MIGFFAWQGWNSVKTSTDPSKIDQQIKPEAAWPPNVCKKSRAGSLAKSPPPFVCQQDSPSLAASPKSVRVKHTYIHIHVLGKYMQTTSMFNYFQSKIFGGTIN